MSDQKEEKSTLFLAEDSQVMPLIYPNNYEYDATSGRMKLIQGRARTELLIHEPALRLIESIDKNKKIGVITICGKARTGKSLIAGELMAPKVVPCPFELGHTMDACTFGIWIGKKLIYPSNDENKVLIVLDVEGTGFHQATKQNDMQLMVIAMLISSYLIYNSKSTFEASALDEIEFMVDLTKKIKSTPNSKQNVMLYKKIFPEFMWLLRDVHLEPTLKGAVVSPRDYFTKKILQQDIDVDDESEAQNRIRKTFMSVFPKYDMFSLPLPHADKEMLKKLGDLPRDQLNQDFVRKLEEFCAIVIEEAPHKKLFRGIKDETSAADLRDCTSSVLSSWIQQCVNIINDPTNVPDVPSLTQIVVTRIYVKAREDGVRKYIEIMEEFLQCERKNDDEKMPLEKNRIIELHTDALKEVMGSYATDLKMEDNNETTSPIQKMELERFYNEIGHDENDPGKTGKLSEIIQDNYMLSKGYCKDILDKLYKPLQEKLDDPSNTFEKVMEEVNELRKSYYDQSKGPAKIEVLDEFEKNQWPNAEKQFKQLKGFSEDLIKKEKEKIIEEKRLKKAEEELKEVKTIIEQQKKLHEEEIKRSRLANDEKLKRLDQQLRNETQRVRDLQEAKFQELADTYRERLEEIENARNASEQRYMQTQRQLMETHNHLMVTLDRLSTQSSPRIVPVQVAQGEPDPFCLLN